MPELPEVETTRSGIAPYVTGIPVTAVIVRERRLRWPVPRGLESRLRGTAFRQVERRAKYLLFHTDRGCMIVHLGMSGSLRIVEQGRPAEKHDHVDIVFASGYSLRFRDPRRFGSIHWTGADPLRHKLLCSLGPEPLSDELSGRYLHGRARGRRIAVKNFIMDSGIVVGVGNIYASEALFGAGILPRRAAGRVSLPCYERLACEIKEVLRQALRKGGTTLRDFVGGDGEPGLFSQDLQVYDRAGQPCLRCRTSIRLIRQGQRSSYYCPTCQR